MKLIKDLGIEDFGTYRKRVGIYECPCCKEHFKARSGNIKSGKTSKCKQCSNLKKITHGDYKTRLYGIWAGVKYRCRINNDRNSEYKGKGIGVCEEWLNYESFREWSLANGYQENLFIDRIDNEGAYNPSNCRWVAEFIQSQNTRLLSSRNKSGYRGVSFDSINKKWVAQIMNKNKHTFLGRFENKEDAVIAYNKFVRDNKTFHPSN